MGKKTKEYNREELLKKASLKTDEVVFLVGFSKSSLQRRMLDSDFPKPMRIGPKTVRWKTVEVVAWLELSKSRSAVDAA